MTPENAEEAVRLYREFYTKEGVFRAPLYDGISELLEKLTVLGYRNMVVTSKPADLADVVVEHNGIRKYFDAIVGPTRAEKHSDKTILIETAMKLCKTEGAHGVVTPGDVMNKESSENSSEEKTVWARTTITQWSLRLPNSVGRTISLPVSRAMTMSRSVRMMPSLRDVATALCPLVLPD